MSHENSMQINQEELASEYGRYVEAKSKKGVMRFTIRVLLIPFIAMLIILTGAAFIVANNSPALYAKAKDIVFEKVDIEKLTGLSNATSSEYLDNWLVINAEQQQAEGQVENESQQATMQEQQSEIQPQ